MERIIMHIDVNNAFLSWSAIDLLNNGSKYDIRDSYAVIGGDPKARKGIVLAKSTPAKKRGVKTAETLFSAKKKCPALRVYPPNFNFYHKMSEAMFDILATYTSDIEIASIDECYLDYGKIKKINGDEVAFAYKIQKEIYEKLGFTVNIGIANNKLCAKMASDFSKPFKVHTCFDHEIKEKMFPLPIGDLFGVGKRTEATLKEMGINTIGDLANFPLDELQKKFKNQALHLKTIASGVDLSPVISEKAEPKCISTTNTLSSDAKKISEVLEILKSQAESIGLELRKKNKYAYVVAALVKNKDFVSSSKQLKLNNPTNISDEIYNLAVNLIKDVWDPNGIRLVGIRVSSLVSNYYYQPNMFENNCKNEENLKLEKAIDAIKEKYGVNKINKGIK